MLNSPQERPQEGSEPPSISEEVIGLSYHYLTADRQAEIDTVIRVLQEDQRFDFLLAIFAVTINDRPLAPETRPTRALLKKILAALEGDLGPTMLYSSPYNELGDPTHPRQSRVDYWDLDIADYVHQFRDLQTVRAFLRHGTGRCLVPAGRSPEDARLLHDMFFRALTGRDPDSRGARCGIWGCCNIQGEPGDNPIEGAMGLWPAEQVSGWYYGVFWDDLIAILNPSESTLILLALTSA